MSDQATGSGPRYHALDCVRATAMLLGVFYHAIQMGLFGGGGSLAAMMSSFAVMEWLHCFRMPLFFAISGFFCHMMLGKYGTARFLAKRWWRIGAPMVVALFMLACLHMATRPENPGDFGGQGLTPGRKGGNQPTSPPPLSHRVRPSDEDGVGSLNEAESKEAMAAGQEPPASADGAASGVQGFPAGFDFSRFMPRVGLVARWLFGSRASQFNLGALWFLWYLLVFATIAPFATRALGWLLLRPNPELADRLGRRSIRLGLVPLALGLLSVPALMQTKGLFGWSLGMAEGIFATFPDVLYQYQVDMPFYFAYFLAGWWLYRLRDGLPDVARLWLPSFVLGCLAFMATSAVSGAFATQTGLPHYRLIRLGGYSLYSVASAYLVWGFLGFFQRYVDRPTRVGRYLADTAFWVYLSHQELLGTTIRWLAPLHLYWWGQALLASLMTTAAALVLFEILVRPTPLNSLFGVAGPRRVPRAVHLREAVRQDIPTGQQSSPVIE